MSWISLWLRGGGKTAILNDLFAALQDGKITQAELQAILVKVGLGVVNKGLPGRLRKVYDLTDPNYLRNLGAKTIEDIISKVDVAHVLLGGMLEEVG